MATRAGTSAPGNTSCSITPCRTQDLFSFSRPGAPWFAWEWLSDVLYAVLFGAGGLKAIVLFAGVLIAGYATVILRYSLWRGANALLATFTHVAGSGRIVDAFFSASALVHSGFLPDLYLVGGGGPPQTESRWIWILMPSARCGSTCTADIFLFLACLALSGGGHRVVERMAGERPLDHAPADTSCCSWRCAAASLVNPLWDRVCTFTCMNTCARIGSELGSRISSADFSHGRPTSIRSTASGGAGGDRFFVAAAGA